jgi:cyclase
LLFSQVKPLVLMGSVDGARRALDWIATFEPDWVIPGHGPVITGDDLSGVLDAHHRYYRLVTDTAQQGLRAGLSPVEAAAGCDLGSFAALPDSEQIVLNLHRAYSEISD